MSNDAWDSNARPVEERSWLLSGFCRGVLIRHEFCGPSSGSHSIQYSEIRRIGRDAGACDFAIPEDELTVSRVHAELKFFMGRGLGIRNLSSNGTFVNDERISDSDYRFLDVSDKVRLGALQLQVSYPR